jgi:hypothetical protein
MKRKCGGLMDEIHKIRREIYEEIKDMSAQEVSDYFETKGEEIAKQNGFIIV